MYTKVMKKGFTLIELLLVIAIIGFISTAAMSQLNVARERAKLAQATEQMRAIANALSVYASDHGGYPRDAGRGYMAGYNSDPMLDVSNQVAPYLNNEWPVPPWEGATYDWDNAISKDYIQITMRFCKRADEGGECFQPNDIWTSGLDDPHAGIWYCIEGPCPYSHPTVSTSTSVGFCLNCGN
jgi:prepilin-type N-terminal cleavage/methylation domain-containing protein